MTAVHCHQSVVDIGAETLAPLEWRFVASHLTLCALCCALLTRADVRADRLKLSDYQIVTFYIRTYVSMYRWQSLYERFSTWQDHEK